MRRPSNAKIHEERRLEPANQELTKKQGQNCIVDYVEAEAKMTERKAA